MILFLFLLYPENVLTGDNSYLFVPDNSNFYIYGRGGSFSLVNRQKLTSLDINGSIEKLSSAKRILRAGDDPAGLAVSDKMKSIINGLRQEAMNAADLKNYMNYMESAIAHSSSVLMRMNTLTVKAAGGILGPEDREIIQVEIDQLKREIDASAQYSEFNRKKVIPSLTSRNLGLDRVNVVRDLYGSAAAIENARKRLIKLRTVAGVKSNILSFRIKGKYYYLVNLQASESRIRDLDYPGEVSRLINNSVLLKINNGVLFLKK